MQVADVAVQVISVTHPRYQVIDFTVPYGVEPIAILIPAPAEDSRLFAYTKPFQTSVIIPFPQSFSNVIGINRNVTEFLVESRQ